MSKLDFQENYAQNLENCLALAKIVADSGKKGSKAKGLCIFCKKNSFQGLEAINLKLIQILHIIAICGENFKENLGRLLKPLKFSFHAVLSSTYSIKIWNPNGLLSIQC